MNRDSGNKNGAIKMNGTDYASDRDLVSEHVDIVELRDGLSMLTIATGWQARVMTSSCDGENGFSFGWVNRDLMRSGVLADHINPFGGEERLWLGPEGGQFALFFKPGAEFDFDHWQTPPVMDTEAFELLSADSIHAEFSREASLENWSGTTFNFRIDRKITLLDERSVNEMTGSDTEGVRFVAYRSENSITNTGSEGWTREGGLISIWMLGMFNPSPSVVVVIPLKEGDETAGGRKVNDNYFGPIGPDRLKESGNHVFFRADGKSRGKIGIPPQWTTGRMGSYDPDNRVLTLLLCDLPEGAAEFVNSAWEIQADPFSGDAFNSYNDGPLDDGSILGPFYELESSSPALSLSPGGSYTHSQVTIHITGEESRLDIFSRKVLGVGLEMIKTVF